MEKERVVNAHDDEYIDIEIYVKEGKEIPKGKKYIVKIDRDKYKFDIPVVTGRDLLTKAGKTPPDRYRIDQIFKSGATKKVELNEKVDLAEPGVECFKTLPLDQTEG